MAEKLASWIEYQKNVKAKIEKADSKGLKRIVEKNVVDSARAGLSAEAVLSILIKKKILTKKEVLDIVDYQLKTAMRKK